MNCIKKRAFLLLYFCWSLLACIAQNEISTTSMTGISKMAKQLKGFEIGYTGATTPIYCTRSFNANGIFNDNTSNPDYLLNTFQINYFQEHTIFKNATIILKGGVHLTPIKTAIITYTKEKNYTPEFTGYQLTNHLGVLLSAEPRYYIRFNKHNDSKNINALSGGFITFPIEYISYTNYYQDDLIKLYFSPQLGFRQSISNHIFVEAMFGCRITGSYGLSTQTISPFCLPTASIKVCYSL